jgi:tetratricopeptide (TPR) repeat protein
MTDADAPWLKRAEELANGATTPRDESRIHYAIGKYYDDLGDFKRAFRAIRRANELQKLAVDPYDYDAHTRLVDDLKRTYTREVLTDVRAAASDSQRPVFVVGMPRSGTSLVEQIIATHPRAAGAGELGYWSSAMQRFDTELRNQPVVAALKQKLSVEYLRILQQDAPDAARIVDKATFNAEYLGVIHAVFPNARIIYLRRDPIDVCLSCYFNRMPEDMNFAMDLADLAHYYREHQRLVSHWRGVLPEGTLLDVPYAELVKDQAGWSRRIIEFLGLDWDERCLDFQNTERAVRTASYRQVRQGMYQSSIGRWRNYQKYLGPILELRDGNR